VNLFTHHAEWIVVPAAWPVDRQVEAPFSAVLVVLLPLPVALDDVPPSIHFLGVGADTMAIPVQNYTR
jgi:hypothetical protein